MEIAFLISSESVNLIMYDFNCEINSFCLIMEQKTRNDEKKGKNRLDLKKNCIKMIKEEVLSISLKHFTIEQR